MFYWIIAYVIWTSIFTLYFTAKELGLLQGGHILLAVFLGWVLVPCNAIGELAKWLSNSVDDLLEMTIWERK